MAKKRHVFTPGAPPPQGGGAPNPPSPPTIDDYIDKWVESAAALKATRAAPIPANPLVNEVLRVRGARPQGPGAHATALLPGLYPILGEAGTGKSVLASVLAKGGATFYNAGEPTDPRNQPLQIGPVLDAIIAAAHQAPGRVHVVDSMSPLIYEISRGGFAAGGFPRRLPLALIAINQHIAAAGSWLFAVVNPFAPSERDEALVRSMIDGSCSGFVTTKGVTDHYMGGGRLLTIDVSLRPDARGSHAVRDLTIAVK